LSANKHTDESNRDRRCHPHVCHLVAPTGPDVWPTVFFFKKI
jgi:hypothetical protein